jgi:hypothetical protein
VLVITAFALATCVTARASMWGAYSSTPYGALATGSIVGGPSYSNGGDLNLIGIRLIVGARQNVTSSANLTNSTLSVTGTSWLRE